MSAFFDFFRQQLVKLRRHLVFKSLNDNITCSKAGLIKMIIMMNKRQQFFYLMFNDASLSETSQHSSTHMLNRLITRSKYCNCLFLHDHVSQINSKFRISENENIVKYNRLVMWNSNQLMNSKQLQRFPELSTVWLILHKGWVLRKLLIFKPWEHREAGSGSGHELSQSLLNQR